MGVKFCLSHSGAQPEFLLAVGGGGGWGSKPEVLYNFFYFTNYVIKLMLQAQHNAVCNCVYILVHTGITTYSMTRFRVLLLVFL
jgi:hypothetical protein